MKIKLTALLLASLLVQARGRAGEVFVEAESFKSCGGWEVVSGPAAREASGLATLNGAGGAKDGVATVPRSPRPMQRKPHCGSAPRTLGSSPRMSANCSSLLCARLK